ncbi:MAG: PaaI family thioesterase [Rhodospirillales bacterium]|nr:PaaI family thioesterase [Rhodospirillales bacterium]
MSEQQARAQALFNQDGYARHLGIELVEVGQGRAVMEMEIQDRHLNFLGAVHGGAIFSLADMAFGLASNTEQSMRVGIDAHIAFVARVDQGERIRASAFKFAENRRTAVYQVNITRNAEAIATFTGTVYITNRPFSEALESPQAP